MGNSQSTFEIIGKFSGMNQINASFDAIYKNQKRMISGFQDAGKASEACRRNVGRTFEAINRGHMRAIGGGFQLSGLRYQLEGLRAYTDEAMKLSQAQERFKLHNLSSAENQQAFRAVQGIVDTIKGANLADTTETLSDVFVAVGDLHHAMAALPMASKYRFGFETIFGDKFSKEEVEQQIAAAMKYLEATGAVAKGEAEMEKRFNLLAQMVAGSEGRTTPAMMLQMARRAGPAAQGLSEQGMRNMSGLVQELGGEGAGTALMSLFQSQVAGKMAQKEANEFIRLGLLDPHKIKFGTGQKIKEFLSGANKLAPLLQEDPLKAADALMEAMKHPLHGPAIDTTNANKVREELAKLFGNRTAQKLMSILTTQRNQIVKESHLAEIAKNIQQTYDQALGSPAGKVKVFENNLRNLEAELGGPLLAALSNVGDAAVPLLRVVGAHPQAALMALAIYKLVGAAGALRAAGLPSLIMGIYRSLVGAGVGTAAAGGGSVALQSSLASLLGGPVAVQGAATAGAGLGAGFGIAFTAAAAIPLLGITAAIVRQINSGSQEEEAAAAGERIGLYLAERFKNQIEGKLSTAVSKELDRVAGPRLVEDILKKQGLDTAGRFWTPQSDFVNQIEWLKSVGSPEGLSGKNIDEYYNRLNRMRSTIYNSGISSSDQMEQYLAKAYQTFQANGRLDLYPELEKLTREAFPQFAAELDKIKGIGPAAESAIDALQRLGGVQPSGSFFGNTTTAKRASEFHLIDLPSRAMGGDVHGDGFVKVHRGERILPAGVTKGITAAHAMRAYAGEAGEGANLPESLVAIAFKARRNQ
jgi:hypothetical protein